MAIRLAQWNLGCKVLISALAGSLCCVLGQYNLFAQSLSLLGIINGYRQTARGKTDKMLRGGGNLQQTSNPSSESGNCLTSLLTLCYLTL